MATLQAAYNTFGDNWGATWSDHKEHLTMLDAALACVHEDINVGETAMKYKQYLAAKNSINELTRIVTATQRCVERILMAQTFE
jgi:hypothetical protein